MSETKPPHILTVKAGCDDCASNNPDDWCTGTVARPERCLDFTIDCPGVTADCQAWRECSKTSCRDLSDDDEEQLDQTGELHGVEHRRIDGYLAVEMRGICYVAIADCLPDAVDYLGVGPGIYAVRAYSDGESGYDLEVVETLVSAEAAP